MRRAVPGSSKGIVGMMAALPLKADTLPRYHPLVLSDGALQPLVLLDGGANVLGN